MEHPGCQRLERDEKACNRDTWGFFFLKSLSRLVDEEYTDMGDCRSEAEKDHCSLKENKCSSKSSQENLKSVLMTMFKSYF